MRALPPSGRCERAADCSDEGALTEKRGFRTRNKIIRRIHEKFFELTKKISVILGKPHHPYCVLDGGVFLCAASSKQHSRCSGLPKGNPQVPQYCFSSSPKISGVALRFSGCPLFGAHIFINAAHSPFPI